MGETTQGRTGKWAKRPGGETTRGERESGRNDSGANGKVGETTRILSVYHVVQVNVTLSYGKVDHGYSMERHNCHLTLNIQYHTTSSNMHCSFFIMRGIFNIMCGGLNNMRCIFFIMCSGFIIMRCTSCKWCRILIIMFCAFVKYRPIFRLCILCFTLFAVHNYSLTEPYLQPYSLSEKSEINDWFRLIF